MSDSLIYRCISKSWLWSHQNEKGLYMYWPVTLFHKRIWFHGLPWLSSVLPALILVEPAILAHQKLYSTRFISQGRIQDFLWGGKLCRTFPHHCPSLATTLSARSVLRRHHTWGEKQIQLISCGIKLGLKPSRVMLMEVAYHANPTPGLK